jgi:hypothetical protein
MRRRLPSLLALSLSLAACKDEPEPLEPEEYTGPLAPGDWKDEGPFAQCGFTSGECGAEETLQLDASCEPSTLASLAPDSVFTMHVRSAAAGSASFGFRTLAMRLTPDRSADTVSGMGVVRKEVAADRFYLAAESTLSNGDILRRAFKGCRMRAPGELVGCYAECRAGRATTQGSFEAVQVVTPSTPGEALASGLTLLSETAVSRGTPVDVYVTKGHAYVVSLDGGLYVYDVRDAARPVLTRHEYAASDNYWNGVWASGDTLYVASADRGVLVYDISNPGTPVRVREVPSQRANVHTVFVQGELLFAASADPDGVVLIFDISEPLSPVLLSKFLARDFNPRRSYGPHDMFAFEDRLYVNYWGAGYVVADVSNPQTPRELGRYRYERSTSHANAVGRIGERLIAFEGGEDWGAHLRVLDVTNPAQMKLLAQWRLHEHISLHNMVLVGTKLYIAHYHNGVRVLDVSVPELPRPVAHYNTFRPYDVGRGSSFYDGALGIRVPGDGYVYTVDSSRGLLILKEE